MFVILLCMIGYSVPPVFAEDKVDEFQRVSFVILKSTKSFEEAVQLAKGASGVLKTPLQLRGVAPQPDFGLTFTEEDCNEGALDYPCYIPRGRYDSGEYVSLEWSSAYQEFSPGFFLVISASGEPDSLFIKASLSKARKFYSRAYVKTANVYIGCIH